MQKFIFFFALLFVCFSGLELKSQDKQELIINSGKSKQSVQYEMSNSFTSINQMKCWVSNTNPGAIKRTLGGAIEWPGGRNAFKQLVFFDGLQLLGYINGEPRALIQNSYFLPQNFGATLQPGKIFDDGTPDNPNNSKYRIYKIQKGWESLPFGAVRDELERDYNQWPVDDGAPWVDIDGDGFFSRGVDQPDFIGDEVLFFVSNDSDPSLKLAVNGTTYSDPFNIEFQVLTFAKQGTGILGDVVFRKIKLINKSNHTIEDFVISWYSDIDIGGPGDDAAGIDTSAGLMYTYNYTNNDVIYGEAPPAAGYILVYGPKVKGSPNDSAYYNGKWIQGYRNLEMVNFNYFRGFGPVPDGVTDSAYYYDKIRAPRNVEEYINTINGLWHNERPFVNPYTGEETLWPLSGDPVSKSGWYDHPNAWPGDTANPGMSDKYSQFAIEGFDFAPFDTAEVVIAVIAAQGDDNILGIEKLRRISKAVKKSYLEGFRTNLIPQKPLTHSYEDDQSVTLWWEGNAESFDEFDIFLENQGLSDTTYTFEGYIVEQYSDSLGNNPETIFIADKVNGVTVIEDNQIVNGVSVKVPVIFGSDSGLKRFININSDAYTNGPLLSGSEYYFGVSAYAYSRFSDPSYLKSEPNIFKIIPGKSKIDFSSPYSQNENVESNQTVGVSDATVSTQIIDPASTTEHTIKVEFVDTTFGIAYNLINAATQDTLTKLNYQITPDIKDKQIYNGFILLMNDYGRDSIIAIDPNRAYAVNEILEIRNEEGYLDTPTKLLNKYNSTNKWKFRIGGVQFPKKSHLNYAENIGYNTYEIRFTEEGSEYYTTGYSPLFFFRNDDPKGKGRLPFEIWQISRDGKETKRLIIKVFDQTLRDTAWTKDETTNMWERFYCYEPDGEYPEVFPETSGRSFSAQHRVGNIVFEGEQPEEGTIIRITTFRPLSDGDEFEISLEAPNFNDTESGKEKIDEISVFPNPFFAGNNITNQNYVRFIGLPTKATIRIFTISGQLIRKLEKDDQTKYIDWDVRNGSNQIVAGGMYIAHLDMPGIGTKVLKVAVIPSKEFLDIR
ncbi:MAG: T9SS type A sorting domain-containing protein [Melioribacteraceae bacterium]|nr:MAG: T9SS type A sorting domain-containing protein [Melioribacteraceae bacterium]